MHGVNSLISQSLKAGHSSLSEAEGKLVLESFGVRVPKSVVINGEHELDSALTQLQYPLVLKVVSSDILHKSDAGGVALNLASPDAVKQALQMMRQQPLIQQAKVQGFLLEEMLPAGQEIVVGAVKDPYFGHMVMVGLGGIFVEILEDVSFRICPVTEQDARDMLTELRGKKILDGARGIPAVNQQAIVDVIMRIAGPDGLLMSYGHAIEELDINPLIVSADHAVAADARFILRPEPSMDESSIDTLLPHPEFDYLFEPKTIAVVGASTTSSTMANTFIRRMKAYGYPGEIYPIHPKADELEDLTAYPSLAETPKPIDYAYIAIGAKRIPALLSTANGRVRFAQVLSSGFGETLEGQSLERELVESAREGGCRLIGPNCLGMYSPRGRVTFSVNPPKELGTVGVISQSGGLGTDIIKRGQWRGVRFSGLVTMGNSADLGPVDLVEYYLQDVHTQVIGMYLEGLKDGRRLFELLRKSQTQKPIVILKGGRSALGNAAAASHTGALAGDQRAWEALSAQSGCIMVHTVDDFIDALLLCQNVTVRPQRPTQQVVLFGNGGGTGVLATDYFAELGLSIAPFDEQLFTQLDALNLPPGTSVANPIDAPVATLQEEEGWIAGKILDIVYQNSEPDAIVMHLNLASFVGRGDNDPVDNLIKVAEQTQQKYPGRAHFLLVLRSDGSKELDEIKRKYRQRALEVGIPVYDEISNAANALHVLRKVEVYFGRQI